MNRRNLIVLALLLIAALATLFIATRPPPPAPTSNAKTSIALPFVYLLDVAGWYEITPHESAVASALDFSIENLKEFPPTLGAWRSEAIKLGSEINEWFENPDLAVSHVYHDERGHMAWFSAFGSRGRKSYFLFEHTPITSYPVAGWRVAESAVTPITINDKAFRVQKAVLTKDQERRVVFYWYLWSDFNRDPEKGVLTMRLHIPVVSTDQDALDAGADFLRALFPQVITWKRF